MKKWLSLKNISIFSVISPFLLISAFFGAGCDDNNRILDPTQTGRFRPVPAVNVILDTLGVEDEIPPTWADAEDPMPEDSVYQQGNYTFSTGDAIRIVIFELLQEGVTFTNDYIVDESGRISVPQVGVVEVGGLTERQVEEELYNILKPDILINPFVTATMISSQRRTFSIEGAGIRAAGGRFSIPRSDFRLLDAIAQAGGIAQFNVEMVYVSRTGSGYGYRTKNIGLSKMEQPENFTPQQQMLKMAVPNPAGQNTSDEKRPLITGSELANEIELFKKDNKNNADSLDLLSQISALQTKPADENDVEWVFKDGKFVTVGKGQKEKIEQTPLQPEQLITRQLQTAENKSRLIRIPVNKLVTGDPMYNIVIREGDVIHVPVDLVGEFWVSGNVNNKSGAFDITGRPLTIKMAITAAGGLSSLAWPKHCEITRRIGKDKEETVMVDFDKISRGEQPDFFIKPNDLINVGTHPTSQWREALRGAFRATYGFAFIYDRNFSNREFGFQHPLGPFGL
jgi:polysaccharide export outer membrane protein